MNERSINIFFTKASDILSFSAHNLKPITQPEGLFKAIDKNKNSYLSFEIDSPFKFNEVICSLSADDGAETETFIKVEKEDFSFGCFYPKTAESRDKNGFAGRMDTDILRLKKKTNKLAVKIELRPIKKTSATIKAINIVLTDNEKKFKKTDSKKQKPIHLDLKGFSQMTQKTKDNKNICSPTSVSGVLSYYGIKKTPVEMAQYSLDNSSGIHGNWLFNAMSASAQGLYSFVARLNSLNEAYLYIKKGIPVIASLTFGENELKGSPLKKTRGHLLIIKGFDQKGNVITSDPAAQKDEKTEIVYKREEFENAWLKNKFGTCYIILKDISKLLCPAFPLSRLYRDKNLKEIETQLLSGELIEALKEKLDKRISALNQNTLNNNKKLSPYEGYADTLNFCLPKESNWIVKEKKVFGYSFGQKKPISLGARTPEPISLTKTDVLIETSGVFLRVKKSCTMPLKPFTQEKAREAIIKTAARFIGDKYVWGGRSSFAVDCSGLASLCYLSAGIELPRNADDQYFYLKKKNLNSLKPGDLIFSQKDTDKKITHVMIYSKPGKIIEATMDCASVREISLREKFSSQPKNWKNGCKINGKILYFAGFFK